jgi:hypothetical protein
MSSQTKAQRLAQWIRKALEAGVTAGVETLRYTQTTFGSTDLPKILSLAETSESDSLLELLFFPDAALQAAYENTWGDTCFAADDQRHVLADLMDSPVTGAIRWEDGTACLKTKLPDFVLSRFVERLNITWRPSPSLARALEHHLPWDRRRAAQVCLRHTPGPWHAHYDALLCTYIEKMPATHAGYESSLQFLLSILSELKADQDHFEFLVSKKSFYFNALCKAEDFERRRRASTMEVLMLQGARAAYGTIDQWRLGMQHIDVICQALYGRTRFFREPLDLTGERTFGGFPPVPDGTTPFR